MQYTFSKDSIAFEAIALESTLLANMADSIKSYFPGFVEAIKPAFDGLSNITMPKIANLFKGKTLEQKLLAADPENVKYLKVSVPEGFQGNYGDYISLLLSAFDYFDEVEKSIDDYYVLLSWILTNKEAKKSLKDETNEYKKLEKSRTTMNDAFSDHFKSRSNEALSTFGKHFKNPKDYIDAVEQAAVLDKRLKAFNIERIKGKVKRIVDTMGVLIEQSNKGNIAYMTPEVAKNIAYGGKEMAYQIEFLSVNIFRAIGTLTALDDTAERVERFV